MPAFFVHDWHSFANPLIMNLHSHDPYWLQQDLKTDVVVIEAGRSQTPGRKNAYSAIFGFDRRTVTKLVVDHAIKLHGALALFIFISVENTGAGGKNTT